MGDSISLLKLKKKLQKRRATLIMENVLFANLHQKIYIIQEMLVRGRLLNH